MNKQIGLSIIGVVVALFILSLGGLAVGRLVVQTQSVSSLSANQFIAVNLAREPLELAYALRDTGWFAVELEGEDFWAEELCPNSSSGEEAFTLEPNEFDGLAIVHNPTAEQQEIWLDPETGEYSHQRGSDFTKTVFTRSLTVDCSQSVGELTEADPAVLTVTSTVEWQEKGEAKNIVLTSRLYDWYDGFSLPGATVTEF